MFKPRPSQQQVLAYRSGKMGVSAVPGSGKTHTLSRLAANLLAGSLLDDDQEILIVTLVNSAVDNFSARIASFVRELGLLPDFGYRVRTLHGLAHDIVRERPDLVGLSDQFAILDEGESQEILSSAASAWLSAHPEFYDLWSSPNSNSDAKTYKKWEESVAKMAGSFIRLAKDQQASPQQISDAMRKLNYSHPLLEMALEIYSAYQRALSYRSAVDFDDLIRLALLALEVDSEYLARLRRRWPYILEDEAQDSSRLQEEILKLLAGEDGNWVRVGDPNQAIYETFTTASPEYLRRFMRTRGVTACDLPDSGRSTKSIISLANELIRWTMEEHPVPELRDALSPPLIRPAPPGDPQPNPPDNPAEIFLSPHKYSPEREIDMVIKSLKTWLPQNQDQTVAVLVPRNERGGKVVQVLKGAGIEVVELLQTSASTRQTADILASVLRCLDHASFSPPLAAVFKEVYKIELQNPEQKEIYLRASRLIQKCDHVEDYLWPAWERDWLRELEQFGVPPEVIELLAGFRERIRRWQQAVFLPIDQLILTISQDLFTNPADLALAHKLALVLERAASTHPGWQLAQFIEELSAVAHNQRRLAGFSEEDTGFDPDQHKGKVVVATIHKAKGLEWDRVYLLSVNNYDFPAAQEYDSYYAEPWYVRDHLNLEAELLEKLRALLENRVSDLFLPEGQATQKARLDYSSERLRLLYVGITRARKALLVTWNTGKSDLTGRENQPAVALVNLRAFWERKIHETAD
jgi:DNA helicase-2/ATP-dependent DNA helicase PcrA